jgi:hypothetical protein
MKSQLFLVGAVFILAAQGCGLVEKGLPGPATPDRLATGVMETKVLTLDAALHETPARETIALTNEASVASPTLPATALMSATATQRAGLSHPVALQPTLERIKTQAMIGETVRQDGWQVRIDSASFEDLGKKLNFQPDAYPPQQMGFLLVNISLAREPSAESMRFSSDDFQIQDAGLKTCTPIGVYLDPYPLPSPFIFPTWMKLEKSHFQAYYTLECGQGCLEYYGFLGKEPEEPAKTSAKPLSAGPLLYENQQNGLWKVLVIGENWQRVYIFLVPKEAKGLVFTFKGLPGIALGY